MEKLDEKQCCATLNLMPGASPAQIKEAYRKLAQQWHPDKHTNNPKLQADAQEKFKKINAAYEFLKTYKLEATNSTQVKREEQANNHKQDADAAERRKQESERREAEQRRQAEYQKQEARRKNEERWRQEAEQREQQAENERRAAHAKWQRDEDGRLRRQKEREAEATREREHLAHARKKLKPITHRFYQGKCLRCGRSKTSLVFYPGSPCL